jgi:hypothetical protein
MFPSLNLLNNKTKTTLLNVNIDSKESCIRKSVEKEKEW